MKKKQAKTPATTKAQIPPDRKSQHKTGKNGPAHWISISIITLLGIIIYSNSFNCSFHFDDTDSIVNNAFIRSLSDLNALWNYNPSRFVAYLSFALNYHFDELDVWGYHLVNLVIHLTNACLVYWLTLLIFSCPALKDHPAAGHKRAIALFTALLFVSHPLATQSVTYIVQRIASLVALFYLLSIALYVKGRLAPAGHSTQYFYFAGSLLAGLLALFTKENAYTLPLAIVLFEACFLQTRKLALSYKDPRIMLSAASVLFLLLIIPLKFSSGIFKPVPPSFGNAYTITSLDYFFTQFSVMVKYLQLLVLPVHQNLDYDFPIARGLFEARTLLSLVVLLSLLAGAVYLFKKNRILSFGIFWFFLTLSVESSFIPLSDVIFEHRTYLPSFGFFLVLSFVIFNGLWNRYRALAIAILLAIIGTNAVLTYQRNMTWQDELTLLNDGVSKSPGKARPWGSRADYYRTQEQWDLAIADYNKALALNPDFMEAVVNRATTYARMGRFDKAAADFTSAIRLDPKNTETYFNRGNAYASTGDWENAIKDYTRAAVMDPKNMKFYTSRGIAYGKLKQWENAVSDYNRALAIDPNSSSTYNSRALAFANLGQLDKAMADFSKAIETDPRNANAYFNRGSTYGNLHQLDKAVEDFTRATEIDPGYKEAYYFRGLTYSNLGQWEKALADFNKVIGIDPKFSPAYANRDVALGKLQAGKK